MKHNKRLEICALMGLIFVLTGFFLVRGDLIPPDSWDFKLWYNLTGVKNFTAKNITADEFFIGDGSLLTNIAVPGNYTNRSDFWGDCQRTGNCITSVDILDVDDVDVEADLNTYVDIAGDTMTGNLVCQAGINVSGFVYADILVASNADNITSLVDECSEITNCVDNAVTWADAENQTSIDAEWLRTHNGTITLEAKNTAWADSQNATSAALEWARTNNCTVLTTSCPVTVSNWINTSVGIDLDDNDVIYFGTDHDVKMYFDGTNFIIEK